MHAFVDSLYRYPVKGLTPERLDSVELRADYGFPSDRLFALAKPTGLYDAGAFVPLSKREYFVLLNTERLAGLATRFDDETRMLTVTVQGHPVLEADLSTRAGRDEFVELYARVTDLPEGVRPVFAEQPGYNFTDNANDGPRMMNSISLINLASIRDLERRSGVALDPLRFRANVYLDGPDAWAERAWIGRELRLGASGVTVRVLEETGRCAATEVDPATARRDIPVPRLLHEHYGHEIMGVFAEVVSAGVLATGDAIGFVRAGAEDGVQAAAASGHGAGA
ncbi:MOSC domain-containing protein [Agreia sp. COWG]|uniref:MOSC domain-containing protein n=1 Tax=Agreia sp. COWG TaxID=2773266 RepID=UPI0019256B1E|nr:MOSC N-terminal beta barrel domain-containing protein [Agreia sp. COWG]CAD6011487.1 MOSC domain-containing protein [Agreia sp. COWG]